MKQIEGNLTKNSSDGIQSGYSQNVPSKLPESIGIIATTKKL